MSSLVPEVVNIRQVGKDVESCAKVLSNGEFHLPCSTDSCGRARAFKVPSGW